MRCPFCREINQDKVIDSRLSENGEVIRRRRVCVACNKRFTTKERAEQEIKLMVVKRDGTRMPYDRLKLLTSLQRAAYKRPITDEAFVQLVDNIEDILFKRYDREVNSHIIGTLAGEQLGKVDQIAYVRFASVYRRFQDLGELIDEAQSVISRRASETPGQQQLFE